ncbi:hypothetical protein SCP_0204700 [Sparassis crispa]|uniref:Uncharacterized protein n=1 Tax=Sparassis crispa TaxID=139825 RepID=A0A401GAT3_9APHY|nr:hypothetical protein SCP_0204700 [Sparassis crispa]GBE79272.1 hypothetical protein SCP_0204700 [Sparassis crispa]
MARAPRPSISTPRPCRSPCGTRSTLRPPALGGRAKCVSRDTHYVSDLPDMGTPPVSRRRKASGFLEVIDLSRRNSTCNPPSTEKVHLNRYAAYTQKYPLQFWVVHCTVSSPVVIPSMTGYYTSHHPLHVRYIVDPDIVLGHDWMDILCPIISGGVLVDPDPFDAFNAPQGYTWMAVRSADNASMPSTSTCSGSYFPRYPFNEGVSTSFSPYADTADGSHLVEVGSPSVAVPSRNGSTLCPICMVDSGSTHCGSPLSSQPVFVQGCKSTGHRLLSLSPNIAYTLSIMFPIHSSSSLFTTDANEDLLVRTAKAHGIETDTIALCMQ